MDERVNALEFEEVTHSYFFTDRTEHKKLNGITGVIGNMLGKKFPTTSVVQLSTIYGHDVHKDVEMWIKEERLPSTENGKWLISFLTDWKESKGITHYNAELLVSDFKGTASCIDIVAYTKDNTAILADIKTTSVFDRVYCSLQLSVYKYLFEKCYDIPVTQMYVLSTTAKRAFKILSVAPDKVQYILDKNILD